MDYIRNSKNRKLKTQILSFFARINFGTYRLGLPGKILIFANILLIVSLFFPWLHFESGWVIVHRYWAFSLYLGWIWYAIILVASVTSFFLLSHQKKEHLRGYVPFRLSDAQAIVFLSAMLLVGCTHVIITLFAYTRMSSQEVLPGFGLELAFGSVMIILVFAYFFSQSEKSRAITMSYLDKKEPSYLDEYSDLLDSTKKGNSLWDEDQNMTLPI